MLRFPDTTRGVLPVRPAQQCLQRRDDVATSVVCDNRELRRNHRVKLQNCQFLSQASSFCRSAKCWMCNGFPYKEIHTFGQLEKPTPRMLTVSHTLQPLHPGFMTGNLNEHKDYTQWDRVLSKFGFPLSVSFHQHSISVYYRSSIILRTDSLLTEHPARGGTVGWGNALQAGRIRVRFPIVSLEVLTDIILLAALWAWGRLST
jgi:hypothetical protein